MTQSHVKIMQSKKELRTIKKDSMRMSEYLLKIKNLFDSLGRADHTVSVEDHILHILVCLGMDYNPVVRKKYS